MLPRSMAGLARFRSTGQIDPMEATPHNPVRAAHPLPLQTPVGALAEESTICCPWTQVVHEMPQPVSCPHPTRPANGHHVMVLPIPPHSLRLRSLPIDSSAQQPSHAPWSSCPTAIPTQSLSPYPTTPCSLDSHQQHPAQTLVFQQTTDALSGSLTGMTRRRNESCISAAALVTRMRDLGIHYWGDGSAEHFSRRRAHLASRGTQAFPPSLFQGCRTTQDPGERD